MNEFFRTILLLPPQASTFAREIDELHYWVISVTLVGATLVAAVAAYFVVRYRRRPDLGAAAPNLSPSPLRPLMAFWFELLVIAFLLCLFVGWWVVGFRQFVQLETPPRDAHEIYVTGKQWMWSFAYPNGKTSNTRLFVPAARPVKLLLSSRDVIHSFFVPHFRVKKDVIPGRLTTLWFEVKEPGVYPVYCTEYCGEGHSTMRAEVVALDEQDYMNALDALPHLELGTTLASTALPGAGLTRRVAVQPTLAEMGQRIAASKGCLRCHTVDGAPHLGPTWLGAYGREIALVGGGRTRADEAYLTESMMDPRAKLRAGFQPIMPSYQGLLSAPEVGALVEYMRELSAPTSAGSLSPPPPADTGAPAWPPAQPPEEPSNLEGAP